MADRARKPCKAPGCPELAEHGTARCARHAKVSSRRQPPRPHEAARPNAYRRGYGPAWRKARAACLAAHPLCAGCSTEESPTLAAVVDHVTPHKGDKALFWDQSNWQSLCKSCHDRKTRRETTLNRKSAMRYSAC